MPTGSRSQIGTARNAPSTVCFSLRLRRTRSTQPRHRSGAKAAEIAAMPMVVATASARLRHSFRTTNQISPIPGAILVRIGNAQAAG